MLKDWGASRSARRHMLLKHGVTWEEVDEVLSQRPQVLRSHDVRGKRRYRCNGRTIGGRRLTVIFAIDGTTARVVTAWEER